MKKLLFVLAAITAFFGTQQAWASNDSETLQCHGFLLNSDGSFAKNYPVQAKLQVTDDAVESASLNFYGGRYEQSIEREDCIKLDPDVHHEARYFQHLCQLEGEEHVAFVSPQITPAYQFYQTIVRKTAAWGFGVPKRSFLLMAQPEKRFVVETYCF